ncbi:hypothetical protein F5X96DRAFT_693047 [Biscogniauxia mediterranea]|nr:hypothetical protein F5X96DRAFT_693047 [Biscogniauxia mediterranea]
MPSMKSFYASKGTRHNPIMIDDGDSSAPQSLVPQRSRVIMRGRQDVRQAQPKMPNMGNESSFDPYVPVTARQLDSLKNYDQRIQQRRLAEKRLTGTSGTSSSRISSHNSGITTRAFDEERGGESELLFHDAETARSLDFRKELETGHYHRQGVDRTSARNPSPESSFGNARLSTPMSSGTRVAEPELEFHDAETARRLDYRKVLEDRSYRGSGIDEMPSRPSSSVTDQRNIGPAQPQVITTPTMGSAFDPHDPATARQLDMLKSYEERIHQRRRADRRPARSSSPEVNIGNAEPAKLVEAERTFTPPKYGPASHLFARPSDSKWDDEEDAEENDAAEKNTTIIPRHTPPPTMGFNKRPRTFDEDMEENPFACLDELDDSDASDEFDYSRLHPKRRRRAFNSSRY